jgi:hypothetical protein
MPKKKVLAGIGIAATAAVVCLLGSLGLVPAFAQAPPSTNGTQAIVQSVEDMDDVDEQVGEQNELDDDADEANKGQVADIDDVQEEVEEEGVED